MQAPILTELSTADLKALWYDQFLLRQTAENNLAAINAEIVTRKQAKEKEETPYEDS